MRTAIAAMVTGWAVLIVGGCASLREDQENRDPRGMVMDHQSAVDRGGVGNYLFYKDYDNGFTATDSRTTDRTEEEVYWDTAQSSPTWQPSAELVGETIEISDEIRFKLGSAELEDDSKAILDDVAAVILNNSDQIRSVQVTGHTDNIGSREANQDLSERRAETVKNYLVSKGVTENKVAAVGFGELRPKYDPLNSSPEEVSQNRRVEFSTELNAVAE